jgi:hypothetical protein
LNSQRDQQQQQQRQLRHREQDQIDWRGSQVLELSSQGQTERQIATVLQVGKTTVHKDLAYLSRQAKENLKTHIQDKLPEEYQKCMVGINQVLNMTWSIVNKSIVDDKTRLQALALINDCNKYKMDLTTNGVVITDAIKFVQTNKEKLTTNMFTKEVNNNKESKEPDYDEDKDQLEEE